MAIYFEVECKNLEALFNALPSTLPDHPHSSKLPPHPDPSLLLEEGVWVAFNRAMHATFGDKAKGLKIEERGDGLRKTMSLIRWILLELKKTGDSGSADLVKLWIDSLTVAARQAGARVVEHPPSLPANLDSADSFASTRPKRVSKPNRERELRDKISNANEAAKANQIANPSKKTYIYIGGESDDAEENSVTIPEGGSDEDAAYEDSETGASESDPDSGFSEMENVELADILPRKVDLSLAKGKARPAAQSAESVVPRKRKRMKKQKKEELSMPANQADLVDKPAAKKSKMSEDPPDTSQVMQVDIKTSSIAGKITPPIYHFYEAVDNDENGRKEEGTKYYRCYHGNGKILKVTKKMNGSQTGLLAHLRKNFPGQYKLYELISNRPNRQPSLQELEIAANKIPTDAVQYIKTLEAQSGPLVEAFKRQAHKNEPQFNQQEFERLLACWLVVNDQPFEEVEQLEFQDMVQYLRRTVHIPSATMVKRRIMKLGETTLDDMKKFISELESDVSLSLDAWTSPNGYAFMGIVLHYISNDWCLEERLIDFRELIGEHSGANMANAVYETIESLGLKGRIVSIVMDNASNNDTLVRSLQTLFEAEDIEFNATYARGRCLPHIVHLAALKLLEGIGAISVDDFKAAESQNYQQLVLASHLDSDDDAVGQQDIELEDPTETTSLNAVEKLRRIVKAVRSSPQRRKLWIAEVENARHDNAGMLDEIAKMLILDVRTRWTSTHQMCRRALHYRKEIESYTAKVKELRRYELTPDEWRVIIVVTDWLFFFRKATTTMSATHKPMLSSIHATLKGLQDKLMEELIKLPKTTSATVRNALVAAHTKLGVYFFKIDESPYTVWASLLDPRINLEGLSYDYKDEPEIKAEINIRKDELNTFYEETFATRVNPAVVQANPISTSADDWTFTHRYSKRPAASRHELTEFLKLQPEIFETTDPIKWWSARKAQFPNLSRLARNILAIPGSAVAVERVFSGGRDTISLRRASLKPETIRTLMIVKFKIRADRAKQ